MASIELQQLCKTYPGGVEAVRDVSLQVHDQEFFVLLGPSGCGKTTTLRLIAGLEAATRGRLLLNSQDVTCVPPHRRNLALLFQTPALYPHLTVQQNLVFGRRGPYNSVDQWSRQPAVDDDRERVASTARLLGIQQLLGRKPAELSGGERQRVALGRALLRRPAVFLLDEPLAHVDPNFRAELRQELKSILRERKNTLLWVTHDHAEALALADRIGVMEAGRVLQVGTPVELYEKPAIRSVAMLIGQPAMNLLPGRIVATAEGVWFKTSAGDLRMEAAWAMEAGRAVDVGVRPLDLQLGQDGFRSCVEVMEYAGGAWHVRVRKPAHELSLTVEVGSSVGIEIGAEVAVSWNWPKAHVFDRATGVRIECAPG